MCPGEIPQYRTPHGHFSLGIQAGIVLDQDMQTAPDLALVQPQAQSNPRQTEQLFLSAAPSLLAKLGVKSALRHHRLPETNCLEDIPALLVLRPGRVLHVYESVLIQQSTAAVEFKVFADGVPLRYEEAPAFVGGR